MIRRSPGSLHLPEEKVLARLTALGLSARMPMMGQVAGRHRSSVRGSSLEFSQYREYVPGDDARRLDWRMFGRSDRLYVKEFEAETNLRLCLVADTSGSLGYGREGTTKMDQIRTLAATLACVAFRQGDAVGLYGAGRTLHSRIRPGRTAAHLRVVLEHLDGLEAGGETGLIDVLHEVAESVRQRALVILFSDLFLDPEVLRDAFEHLRFRRHDVSVFHLLDRSEVDFRFEGPVRFVDMEGGEDIPADPLTVAPTYRREMDTWRKGLSRILSRAAIDYHRVNLDDDLEKALLRFLVMRRQGGGHLA